MPWQSLPAALCAIFVAALYLRGVDRIVVAGVLLINWAFNFTVGLTTGSQFIWPLLAAVDWVSAVVILSVVSGRWGLLVVVTYAAQLVTHVAFAVAADSAEARYQYWWALYGEAWAQTLIMLGWTIHGGAEMVRDRRHSSRNPLATDGRTGEVAVRRSHE